MPTKRTTTLLVTAFLLYVFANQTQVGWMYVMSALMAGIVLGAWALNRPVLKGLRAARQIGAPEQDFYEGDEVTISLSLHNHRRAPAPQVAALEQCPLADPSTPDHAVPVFVPVVPAGGAAVHAYDVALYRRGVHTFPRLAVQSRAPFGLFRRRRALDAPSPVLVYPEVRSLRHLALLDRQLTPELTHQRAGVGTEVMGVRPYRTGDSPRHIHWRSVARSGQLISKEFVEETQPGLTLLLDLYAHPYPPDPTKHVPFEWAVKAAASIAEYASRRGYPLHLAADGHALPAPGGPLPWEMALELLAKAQPTDAARLSRVAGGGGLQRFVAAVLPWPDGDAPAALGGLAQRGFRVMAVVVDPASFPAGGPAAHRQADALQAVGVDARLIRFGDDWAEALAAAPDRAEGR